MAQRKTVQIKLDQIQCLLKPHHWKASNLAEMTGKHKNWFSEIKRNRNLPSPEEAAKMCLLLNTTPEEIMLTQGETDEETAKLQADIALVSGLIEQERENQGIKKDPAGGEVDDGLHGTRREIMEEISDFSPEELALVLSRVRKIKESRE